MRIDLAGFARDGSVGDHRALMQLVGRADTLGYDGIWFNEFHFRGATNAYPSTLLLGADVLARTERLRFGTSILVLALQHPLLLAEQIAQLDFQSNGRLDVGIGRGTDPQTFAALGIAPDTVRGRFAEALDILTRAWRGEPISASGPHFPFEALTVGPPVVQRPHPPLYMAAVSEDSIDLAAARGLPLLLSLEPNEVRQMPAYEAALTRHGAGAEPLRRSSLSRYVVVEARAQDAREKVEALLEKLNARRRETARARGQVLPEPRSLSAMMDDFTIAGTPDQCIAQIQALSRRTGCRSLRCLMSANGLIDLARAGETMERFAAEVLPSLRAGDQPEPVTSVDNHVLEGTP